MIRLRRQKSAAGFTMVEMIMVAVILGILGLVALPKYGTVMEQNRISKAKGDLKQLKIALMSYAAQADAFPPESDTGAGLDTITKWEKVLIEGKVPSSGADIFSTLHTWTGPYIKKIPVDPWEHSYVFRNYAFDGTNYSALVCLGPDGGYNMSYQSGSGAGRKDDAMIDRDGFSQIVNGSAYDIVLWME